MGLENLRMRESNFFEMIKIPYFKHESSFDWFKIIILHYFFKVRRYYTVLCGKEIVGYCFFHRKNMKIFYIGYFIKPEHRRKGYATKSVEMFSKIIFKNFYPNKLWAEIYIHNLFNSASSKLLEKNGWKREAVLKDYMNGKDLLIYSKINKKA